MDSAVGQCYSPSCNFGLPSNGNHRRLGSGSASPSTTPVLQVRAAVEDALPLSSRPSTRANRWKSLQNYVGGLAKPDADNAAWTGDRFPGSVDALELHFVFSFSFPEEETSRPAGTDESELVAKDECALLFGDDGHLLFKDAHSTVEIKFASVGPVSEGYGGLMSPTSVERRRSGRISGALLFSGCEDSIEILVSLLDMNILMTSSTGFPLPLTLRDKYNNEYQLNQVFVRKFSFNVGMLRFAVLSRSAIDIQAVLDVQNGIMRLDDPKDAGRLRIIDSGIDKGEFLPRDFIEGILNEQLGEGKWHADKGTDRLFTFTLAGISAAVDEAYVDEFRDNNVYTRFANPNGGLWSCFHPDGGCTLFFMAGTNSLPIWGDQRKEKRKVAVCGSSRPLVAFSLIEAVVFQRMYLRNLDRQMNHLILSDNHNQKNLNRLKKIHGELLKFRAKFSSSPLSTTTAGKQQFHLWGNVVGLHDMASSLLETVKDLHEYYNDIAQQASQRKLDMLAVVLGFLGVAQLVSDVFWAWNSDQPEKRDALNLVVPFGVSGGLMLLAVTFLFLTRRR